MVFGAIKCDADQVANAIKQIKSLRVVHNYHTEIKWTKLHTKHLPFYKALINLFFDCHFLKFKATVVLDKNLLDHEKYNNGSHADFYYKMAYYSLRDFLSTPNTTYQIYFDYVDTQGNNKASRLRDILINRMHGNLELSTQVIRSHESNLIQLCDLLIGAIGYVNRNDLAHLSSIKNQIIEHLKVKSHRSLNIASAPWEEKFNLFLFSPRK